MLLCRRHAAQVLGTIAALASSPLVDYSWQSVFYIYGLVGFVWVVFGVMWGVGAPADHSKIDPLER